MTLQPTLLARASESRRGRRHELSERASAFSCLLLLSPAVVVCTVSWASLSQQTSGVLYSGPKKKKKKEK